ncbi:MAG: hypothetical protein RLZZ347_329 [Candidatus Parcubacteria bacterium]|jgi:uncharacterized UPF0160 family protein
MFGLFQKKIVAVTHDSSFHADDVCAVACLSLLYGSRLKVFRSRDPKVIASGDIVLDVGGKNDGVKNFDHHQEGGAGKRENGVPYAAFGLIWKRFGVEIAGNEAVAKRFDEVFVQPTDATDNGINYCTSIISGVQPISLNALVFACNPTWKDSQASHDEKFFETVDLFKKIIARKIKFLQDEEEAKKLVLADYASAEDKRIIILSKNYPAQAVLREFSEPLYVVYPRDHGRWVVKAMRVSDDNFKNRKDFPLSWAGKRDQELVRVSGVFDAVFAHNARFMAVAMSKEGAIALAKKAIEA